MLVIQYKRDLIDPYVFHAEDPSIDPTVFLAIKVCLANVGDLDQFVFSTQFDVEEPEIYTKAMQYLNTTQ